jgi:flavin reductase (DIM6/NTAB) family NADH-FMN oxidoreductase RutF
MGKIALGAKALIDPKPVLMVGANIDGKPNFMTVAWGGIANGEPPMVTVAIRHSRYTFQGIKQNMTFSVNIPSVALVKQADYCGMAAGKKNDKVKICGFKVFYGKLGNAPLIEQCPVNMECSVVHALDLGSHVLFVGKVEETYSSEEFLTDGKPDITKINPMIYCYNEYRTFGKVVAKAFSAGKELGLTE